MEEEFRRQEIIISGNDEEKAGRNVAGEIEWLMRWQQWERVENRVEEFRFIGNLLLMALGVRNCPLGIVKCLVELNEEWLDGKDAAGNGPLHLAVLRKSLDICRFIAEHARVRPQLELRNGAGETAIFLAAKAGVTDIFIYLSRLMPPGEDSWRSLRRNFDGATVLHVAISRHFFELAWLIAKKWKFLWKTWDTNGESPLHVLVHQPEAFPSGCSTSSIQEWVLYILLPMRLIRLQALHVLTETTAATSSGLPTWQGEHSRLDAFLLKFIYPSLCISLKLLGKSSLVEKKKMHWVVTQLLEESIREHEFNWVHQSSIMPPTLDPIFGSTVGAHFTDHSPIVIAVRNGLIEMVSTLLFIYPGVIHFEDSRQKNLAHIAIENRRISLLIYFFRHESRLFETVDVDGNNFLHFAATYKEWPDFMVSNPAVLLHFENTIYKYIKKSLPDHLASQTNKEGKLPHQIFKETHKELDKEAQEWLNKVTQCFLVLAALIATVAFATAATVPGGFDQNKGSPILENNVLFRVCALSSLVGMSFSLASIIMFIVTLTASHHYKHGFATDKLLLGLTFLYISMAAILISFCAGHHFIIRDKTPHSIYVYPIVCLPVAYAALKQLPLYTDLFFLFILTFWA